MSYQSNQPQVLDLQLKVQELVVQLGDTGVLSGTGTSITVDVGQAIGKVISARHVDDSAAAILVVAAANRAVSGNTVVLTLAQALTAADSITIQYVVAE